MVAIITNMDISGSKCAEHFSFINSLNHYKVLLRKPGMVANTFRASHWEAKAEVALILRSSILEKVRIVRAN